LNRIVIVGASASGLATAEALRRGGYDGTVTLVGDELESPYDRPPLSKQLLSGQWEPARLALRAEDQIAELDLDLRLGTVATGLDTGARTITLADGSKLPYDIVVVATGVRPRRLPGCEGIAGLHVLRTLGDALGLQARLRHGGRLVIVGAGFIGAEVAATSRALGVEVTMLEAAPTVLAEAIGEHGGKFLADLHRDRGVEVRTSAAVSQILHAGGGVTGVLLADQNVVPADDVLVAIGSHPNTEWLDGSGLLIDNGLICDEFGLAAPGVYGAGDVARWHSPTVGSTVRIEHRTNAGEHGMTVAHHILNPDAPRSFVSVPFFWSDQYDTKIQAFGHLRGHDEAVVMESDFAQRQLLIAYRKGERLAGVLAAGKSPKVLRQWRALLAAGAKWDDAMKQPI
jgi:NADPH-dependent 2,4-dienoyl-CoA reductase/sulfur reductase-like enzyme